MRTGGIIFKLSDQLGIFFFLTLIFDGLCFLDNLWLRGGGISKYYITKDLLSFNSKAFPARKNQQNGFFCSSSLSSKIFILVLGKTQDLARDLSSW